MTKKNMIANRYEVIQHIGQGGMADVFRAVDTILNREVAIKILRADLSTDEISILRFKREAQAATALAHPNIVEIYDIGDYKGHHYIVMEFVPGKTLKQVIRSRAPLLCEEAVDIMKQLTSATAEAHSRGIIHRDIKPQNVIVKSDGSIKMLDFGIATAKGSMQLTQANNVMGSVHYLAPELAKGESATPQSDIYALGIVLYEMLAGDVPFKADQAVQVALRHMRDNIKSIRSINPQVPQSVENIIIRATAKDPVQRYRSCDEMWRDLSTCLKQDRLNEAPLVLPTVKNVTKKELNSTNTPTEIKAKTTPHVATGTIEKQKPKSKLNTLLISLILAVVAIGVFFALLLSGVVSLGAKMVKVPNVEGMTQEEAQIALEEVGLTLNPEIEYTLTTNIDKGIIVTMSPDAYGEVEEGTVVDVVISSGKGIYFEDFVAMNATIAEAQAWIDQHKPDYENVRVTAVEEENSNVEPGIVFRQEGIEAGSLYDPTTAANLTLVYSKYPTKTIPADIIGKPINDAVAELESMGLEVLVSNIDSSGLSDEEREKLDLGVVIRVEPNVGEEFTQKEDNYVVLYYY